MWGGGGDGGGGRRVDSGGGGAVRGGSGCDVDATNDGTLDAPPGRYSAGGEDDEHRCSQLAVDRRDGVGDEDGRRRCSPGDDAQPRETHACAPRLWATPPHASTAHALAKRGQWVARTRSAPTPCVAQPL